MSRMAKWEQDCNYLALTIIMIVSVLVGLLALYLDRVFLGVTLVFLAIFVYEDTKRG